MSGGYREKSGRSKSGYYKGIYCGSTYELCWVIYALDHGIEFTRFPGKLEFGGVSYYPDFLLSDGLTIIETKGYELQESVDRKTFVAQSLGYVVHVLRKDDLSFAFDHVKTKYGANRFEVLYDGYKPKFTFTCSFCGVEFLTDKKSKSQKRFCGRSCAGKSRVSLIHTDETRKKISSSLQGKSPKQYKRKNKQIWITDGVVDTRINETSEIPVGFSRGRKKTL